MGVFCREMIAHTEFAEDMAKRKEAHDEQKGAKDRTLRNTSGN